MGIMLRLTEQGNLPANLSAGDFLKRIAVSQLVGDFMDPLGRHAEGWAAINRDNDAAGAHAIRESLEGFATTALLARCHLTPTALAFFTLSVFINKPCFAGCWSRRSPWCRRRSTAPTASCSTKRSPRPRSATSPSPSPSPCQVRRRQVVEGETFTFPLWRARSKRSPSSSYVLDPLEKWEHFPESVQVTR